MAKKNRSRSKKSVSSAKPRSYSQLYKGDNTVPTTARDAAPSVAATAATKSASSDAVSVEQSDDRSNWRSEYAYVVKDMRMLTIVSAVLFALIIVAGFFM
jgi:hypothetical protein